MLANWYANLGAIEMARVELEGWPLEGRVGEQLVSLLGKAEALFHDALQLDSNNRTSQHRLGLISMQQADFASAVIYLERAFLLDEDHRGIWKPLGYCYIWSWKYDQGNVNNENLSMYELSAQNEILVAWLAAEREPRDSLWMAYELIEAGDAEFATDLIKRDTIGGSALAERIVNSVQRESTDFPDKIQEMLEGVDTIAPSDSAIDTAEKGRLDHALLAFHALANVVPETGVQALANFFIYGPYDGDEAEAVLREAVAAYPKSTHRLGWLLSLADVLRDDGRWNEAEALFLQTLEIDPKNPDAYIGLGWTKFDRGDGLEPALADFQQAIALDSESGEGNYAVGQLLATSGLHSDAIVWFDEALRIEPNKQWWHLARADNALDMGDRNQALEYYLDTIERYPDFAYAHHQISWVYRLDNKPARKLYERMGFKESSRVEDVGLYYDIYLD